MANIKQQKKRILITKKQRERNVMKKSRVKNAIKKFEKAIQENDLALAAQLLPVTSKIIDSAKSDGVYHKNNANRKKARLARILDQAKKQQQAQ